MAKRRRLIPAGFPDLLLRGGLLARAISVPALMPLETAVPLMKQALALDPSFDLQVLKHLTDPWRPWPDAIDSGEMERVLDLIRLTVGPRPQNSVTLQRFLKVPNAQVRARAVKMLANRNPVWVCESYKDPDPRVRSNLLEALLEGQPQEVILEWRPFLEEAVQDTHHRPQVTALYYLALSGDERAQKRLEQMLRDFRPPFRAAAEWAAKKLVDSVLKTSEVAGL